MFLYLIIFVVPVWSRAHAAVSDFFHWWIFSSLILAMGRKAQKSIANDGGSVSSFSPFERHREHPHHSQFLCILGFHPDIPWCWGFMMDLSPKQSPERDKTWNFWWFTCTATRFQENMVQLYVAWSWGTSRPWPGKDIDIAIIGLKVRYIR